MTGKSVVRLNCEGPEGKGLPFWGHMENEKVLDGEPTETGYNFFTDASGQLTSGVWECTPYTTEADSYPVDEFCYIISGKVVITDGAGKSETFGPGDSFVIPKGTKCRWHMPETTRKYYVIFDAKPAEEASSAA
jgi:uncharacterized cupin superfamily protein